jgi:hypothetical protein
MLAFANPIFLFHYPTPLSRAYCATRFVTIIASAETTARSRWAGENTEPCGSSHNAHGLEDRCVGNQAALVIKISVRFNVHCKVYSWDGARRCTICDNVTVRSHADALQKTSGYRMAHSSRSASCKWHTYGGELDDVVSRSEPSDQTGYPPSQ